MKDRIFLDNNATTSLSSEVFEVMCKNLSAPPLNPSSLHSFGREAKALLEEARRTVAKALGVPPQEIIFTSGGTESMSLLIKGFYESSPGGIISTNIEHSCVYETLLALEKKGADVSFAEVQEDGWPSLTSIEKHLKPTTKYLILSAVNTETGVKLPIAEIASFAKKKGLHLILDGVGLLGKEEFTIPDGVMGMGFSAHKFHGPKGSGFIFCKTPKHLTSQIQGGSQEFMKRPGTENLAAILGLAKAVEILQTELPTKIHAMKELRDYFEKTLMRKIPGILINGSSDRICNTSNLAFPNVDGESLLILLDREGVAASHGSACSSGSLEPSRVLLNMGLDRKRVKSSIRFSLSRYTTLFEIDAAISVIVDVVQRLQKIH